MIVCPACHAENPDGTKICVKCGTELPKAPAGAAVKAKTQEANRKKFGITDMGRDLVDALWLLFILLLVGLFFFGEATQWTFRFAETEEAKIVQPSVTRVPVRHPRHASRRIAPKKEKATLVEAPPPANLEKPPVELGSPDLFYQKARKQYDSRHYQISFDYLKKALELDPTYAKAYFGLGYLYSRFSMQDAAVRMYEMSLRFDPNHVDSINNLAMMYYHAGNYDDAQALFQKAVSLDGQNADFEYNLGSVYLDENRPDDALEAFQKASALRPDDAAIYNDMALTYEKLGKKQDAEDAWQKVQKFSSDPTMLQQAKTHLDFLNSQG